MPVRKSSRGGERKPRPRVETERSAGAVVFAREQEIEYLLIYSTYWEFPKGLVEPNESDADAALREVREETGLEVTLLPGFRRELHYFYRRGDLLVKKSVVYFLGQATDRAVKVSWEHHEARWLFYHDALAQLKYATARELLEAANEWLLKEQAQDEDPRD